MAYNKETGMYEGWIYIIQNDVEPELIYIGQTYDTLERRWNVHLNQIKMYTEGDKLHRKMEEYGIEHFGMDVLEFYSCKSKYDLIERLDEREVALIAKFDSFYNGLNGTPGGRCGALPKYRPVLRFDLDGNFICEYESVSDLKKEFDNIDSIYGCCSNKYKYAFGSLWKYKDSKNDLPILSEKEKSRAKHRYLSLLPIKKYDYKGNLICIYKNVKDVLKNEMISRRQLIKSCMGQIAFAGNYIYRYNEDSFLSYRTYDPSRRVVEKYTTDGQFVSVYFNIAEAARIHDVNASAINHACNGRLSTVCGFIWKYGDIQGGDVVA